jgi:D-glycero-beta-D-manno-heptose-7-phosphate kinase
MTHLDDAEAQVRGLQGKRVLVVGDLLLDEYLEGRTTRLSREAPVPVVDLVRRTTLPGGAANPARNIVALGGQAVVAGLVGEDEAGERLIADLHEGQVDTAGVVITGDRSTTTKTRVMAYRDTLRFPQHLARIDRIERKPIRGDTLQKLLDRLEILLAQAEAVLVSDYQVGVATPAVVELLRGAAHGKTLLTVDAQGNLPLYSGFDLIKCNRAEAESASGETLSVDGDYERVLKRLLPELSAAGIVITRGPEGLTLMERGGAIEHLPATNRSEVFDVIGAGDTVIAVLTLGLAAGLSLREAAHMANVAAGLVVRRVGNAVVTPQELAAAMEKDSAWA